MKPTSQNVNKNEWIDISSKILIPVCLLILSAVTWYTGVKQSEERLSFEKSNAESSLAIQNNEYFLKKSEHDVSMNKRDAEFLKVAFAECKKRGAAGFQQIKDNADALFSSEEIESKLLEKVKANCVATPGSNVDEGNKSGGYYIRDSIESGMQYMKENKYSQAVGSFVDATKFTPKDASLWNHLAYAQFRSGDYIDAFNSISVAVKLGGSNDRVNKNIAINAAKILCAQGNMSAGRNYLEQAIHAFPGLFETVKKDGELLRVCSLTISTGK
ncbi:hypothetical protein D6445_11385 [Salmonella enterica subsp. enterica serovar Infantis]|nr:hypothetical protein [Salmonella enterica subsp. enterica serovar Infantis]ECL7345022.1 hypothetical protein [Salmonella enterica subsp. enterica serovar Menston]